VADQIDSFRVRLIALVFGRVGQLAQWRLGGEFGALDDLADPVTGFGVTFNAVLEALPSDLR
jgi:hypothetical protein